MQRCPKCLSDYLMDKGLIPVSIDYIKPGMKLTYSRCRFYYRVVTKVEKRYIYFETGKPIKFGEEDLYVFV